MKDLSILMVCFSVFVGGCASGPVRYEEAKDVPVDRQFKFQAKHSENYALLVVIRDQGFTGSGCGIKISIDKEPAGTVKPGEKLEMWLSPKEYLLTGEAVSCLDSSMGNYEVTLKPKQRKLMRVTIPPAFHPVLE